MTSEEQTKRKGFTGSEAWKSSETKAKGGGEGLKELLRKGSFRGEDEA
jgi:hypothetical protein